MTMRHPAPDGNTAAAAQDAWTTPDGTAIDGFLRTPPRTEFALTEYALIRSVIVLHPCDEESDANHRFLVGAHAAVAAAEIGVRSCSRIGIPPWNRCVPH
jgi:hypothetical protein